MMTNIWRVWIPLAFRFMVRHRGKSIASGGFILTGTAILVILQALTTGINDTMVLNTTSLHYGHAYTKMDRGHNPESLAEKLSALPQVRTVLPRFHLSAIIHAGNTSVPSLIFAVDTDREADTTAVTNRLTDGRYPERAQKEILIGRGLAKDLGIGTGSMVSLLSGSGGQMGQYLVSGIFETGIERFDKGISYISLHTLSPEEKMLSTSELSVFLRPGTDDSTTEFDRFLPEGSRFRTWKELMPDLLQLIRMNEVSIGIIMLLVFILVGFGIANTFILTIIERFRELGILRAMGLTGTELVTVVFLECFLLCLFASTAGIIVGSLLSTAAAYQGIDFSAFTSHNRYFVMTGVVYPRITLPGLYQPFLIATVISALSSYIPTRIAARKVTIDTLRFE